VRHASELRSDDPTDTLQTAEAVYGAASWATTPTTPTGADHDQFVGLLLSIDTVTGMGEGSRDSVPHWTKAPHQYAGRASQ
jgi:hypothetical protein